MDDQNQTNDNQQMGGGMTPSQTDDQSVPAVNPVVTPGVDTPTEPGEPMPGGMPPAETPAPGDTGTADTPPTDTPAPEAPAPEAPTPQEPAVSPMGGDTPPAQ